MNANYIVFSVIALLGVGIGLISRKIKSVFFSIMFNAVTSFLVVAIPVVTIFFIAEEPGLLPMVILPLSLLMFVISSGVMAVAKLRGR